MLDRARAIPNVEGLTPYVVDEFAAGETGALATVRVRDVESGETRALPATGAFIAIGHEPQSELVHGQVELDMNGYVLTDGGSTRTNRRRRVRRRGPRRPHVPPGDHGGRLRLQGGARRRVVPARHAARRRRAPALGGDRGVGAVGPLVSGPR